MTLENIPQFTSDVEPVELPPIFDAVSGDNSYPARCSIRAAVSNLQKYRDIDAFCKAVEAAFWTARGITNLPPFELSMEEIKAFAESSIASLPPLPPEPEIAAEQVEQYDLFPISKSDPLPKIVPCPPPPFINTLRLQGYVYLPQFGFQQKEVISALESYCDPGLPSLSASTYADIIRSRIKKVIRPQLWPEIDHWLAEIDACRIEHQQKIENENRRIKEKALAAVDCEFAELLAQLKEEYSTRQITLEKFSEVAEKLDNWLTERTEELKSD